MEIPGHGTCAIYLQGGIDHGLCFAEEFKRELRQRFPGTDPDDLTDEVAGRGSPLRVTAKADMSQETFQEMKSRRVAAIRPKHQAALGRIGRLVRELGAACAAEQAIRVEMERRQSAEGGPRRAPRSAAPSNRAGRALSSVAPRDRMRRERRTR